MGVFEDNFLNSEMEVEFQGFVADLVALEPKLAQSLI
jgi:hypothetical protein